MERVTFRVPSKQLAEVEEMVEDGEFPSRSEAIRTAIRNLLNGRKRQRREQHTGPPAGADGRRTRMDGGQPAEPDPGRDRPSYFTDYDQP